MSDRDIVLPRDYNRSTRKEFEDLGFTFGEPIDRLYQHATLPRGWKHVDAYSMWSGIVDKRGIKRVSIFRETAFWDEEAFMSVTNVGYMLASEFIYGDAAEPNLPTSLTKKERKEARDTAVAYIEKAEAKPSVYGARRPRAEVLLEAAS